VPSRSTQASRTNSGTLAAPVAFEWRRRSYAATLAPHGVISTHGWRGGLVDRPGSARWAHEIFRRHHAIVAGLRQRSEGEEADAPGEGTQHELEVDRRGTELVMEFERRQGRVPVKMDHFNPGYDIESYDASGAIERYIEVKSLSAAWDLSNVGLSVPQFQKARDEGDRFWLYVVDNLSGSDPQLHRIQDPVDKVTEYRFDDGWRHAAYRSPTPTHASEPISPEVGNSAA